MSDSSSLFADLSPRKLLRLALLALLGAFLLLQLWYLFWVLIFSFSTPLSTAFMRSEAVRLKQLKPPVQIQYQWRDYEQINDSIKHAAIAAEDSRFIQHHGFDWSAMMDGWQHNQAHSQNLRGGSTITQQLAKNL